LSDLPPDVSVRRSTAEDIEGIWRCIDTAVREGWFTFADPPPLEMVRSSIMPNSITLVAECGEQVVGWCDVTPRDSDDLRHTGSLGMALLPAFRDQGLGRRILDATIQAAQAAGVSRIELRLLASNVRALALYERCGFVQIGREPAQRADGGTPVDVLTMALVLPSGP
jgi:RimJ/RimL family protein N-acetyltransferase